MKHVKSDTSLRRRLASSIRARPARLLLVAAVFHVALVVLIYLVGQAELVPGMFDVNGFGALVGDNHTFHKYASELAVTLSGEGISAWLVEPSQVHVKLFSLSFAVFGPLFGFTTLAAEPLNLLCYLAVLALVFELGREIFDRRAGLLAAVIVGLWPSFLLSTTQLQRDPLYVASVLALVLFTVKLLERNYSWRSGLTAGLAAAAAGTLAWFVRISMDKLVLLIAAFGLGLLAVRMLRERRILAANLAGVALLLALTVASQSIPQIVNMSQAVWWVPGEKDAPEEPPQAQEGAAVLQTPAAETLFSSSETTRPDEAASWVEAPQWAENPQWAETPLLPNLVDRLGAQVSFQRSAFIYGYPNLGSNIDTDVQFNNMADILRYLPRAMEIGFFAPFPNMWFTPGTVAGLGAKLVSGWETLVMYVLEFFALLVLWWERRRLSAWFLLLVTMMGVTLLSTVMTNVGAVYRQRYAFVVLMIVLGAVGVTRAFSVLHSRKRLKAKDRGPST